VSHVLDPVLAGRVYRILALDVNTPGSSRLSAILYASLTIDEGHRILYGPQHGHGGNLCVTPFLPQRPLVHECYGIWHWRSNLTIRDGKLTPNKFCIHGRCVRPWSEMAARRTIMIT
jgi:hypothetical protein